MKIDATVSIMLRGLISVGKQCGTAKQVSSGYTSY